MPLDTTITLQYRHGQSTAAAARYLFRHGGYSRFYSGLSMALVQGPMSRFGDTAANAALLHWFDASERTQTLPTVVKTSTASVSGFLPCLDNINFCIYRQLQLAGVWS